MSIYLNFLNLRINNNKSSHLKIIAENYHALKSVINDQEIIMHILTILHSSFWSGAGTNAVVVEADAFKERDVIYRAISSRGHHQDMLQTAELVIYNCQNRT